MFVVPRSSSRLLHTNGFIRTFARRLSSVTHYSAAASAPREVPTPLVLLSASRWTGQPKADENLSSFVKHFTANGWSVSCIDLDPEGDRAVNNDKDSSSILQKLEKELIEQLRKGGGPFPPLLVARGLSTLIAESYVSSNPLSGLALLDPPLSTTHAHEQFADKVPSTLPPFTYEPKFPSLVAYSPDKVTDLAFYEVHRIEEQREEEAGESLDRYVWILDGAAADEELENAGPYGLRKWAEDNGIGQSTPMASDRMPEEVVKKGIKEKGGEKVKLERPSWYTNGAYKRNEEKNKKMPLVLDESHLEESFIRGSGPGGQAINKLSTCVLLKHKPTGLIVRSQDTRSREQNREIARRKLSQELEIRMFGEQNSVIGKKLADKRQKKQAKKRKQQRKRKELLNDYDKQVKAMQEQDDDADKANERPELPHVQ